MCDRATQSVSTDHQPTADAADTAVSSNDADISLPTSDAVTPQQPHDEPADTDSDAVSSSNSATAEVSVRTCQQ